jgi:hypothetical protein
MLRRRGACMGVMGFMKIYERGMGAPVFALLGYAAASQGIPQGFARRCVGWLRGENVPPG